MSRLIDADRLKHELNAIDGFAGSADFTENQLIGLHMLIDDQPTVTENSSEIEIDDLDKKYIRRFGMTREAIRETMIRVQNYAVGLLDCAEDFLGKNGTDYGDGLGVLNDIKDDCDCPHDKKLFVPYMKNVTLFMHLISGRTLWGGYTSALEACDDCGLDPDKFGTRTPEDVNEENPGNNEDNEDIPFC